jgi:hypothetical protein
MRSKITSPGTLAAVAELETRRAVVETRTRKIDHGSAIADVVAKIAALDESQSAAQQEADAAQAAFTELQADDIFAERPVRPLPREIAELVRKARQGAGATPTARARLEKTLAELNAQSPDVNAEFAGAVFNHFRRRQRAAQDRIREALAATAPDLAELLALDALQRRYCGGQLTLRLGPGEAAPFSGEVVVRNFTAQLPLQFRSGATELLKLSEQSADVVKELSAEIEGNL